MRETTCTPVGTMLPSLQTRLESGSSASEGAYGFGPEELSRYSRHLLLPEVGLAGQARLRAARVLVVGAGGLGAPVSLYLAAAGVGTLGLVDADVVDVTNLQRQVLYTTSEVGTRKLDAARDRLRALNPNVAIESHDTLLTRANALELVGAYDLVIDGTDNFPTRYLVNDAAVLTGRPNVYGSVFRFEGQASVFAAPGGPCYRCLFREPPPPGLVPSCAEGGVLGVMPGLIGMLQATEALKLILGVGTSLVGRLLLVDALGLTFRTLRVEPDPECPACGTHTLTELIDYEAFCGLPGTTAHAGSTSSTSAAGAHATNGAPATASSNGGGVASTSVPEITPTELAAQLARSEAPPLLLDVRELPEWQIARIEGARLVPLGTLPSVATSLDPTRATVVYCKSGGRSAQAVRQLQAAGFANVASLAGGITRWRTEVDPSLTYY